MASNFKILMQRTNGQLQINLAGDFDATSAFELLDVLAQNLENINRVYINTDNLKRIYPFGWEVFQNNLYKLKHHPFRMRFVGENARQIAPTETKYWCKVRIS
jgi:hypothetical protein